MELDQQKSFVPYISRRRSYVWTEDEDKGLPGAPDVVDFIRPMPRKKIAKEFIQTQSSFLAVTLTTVLMLLVTFYDWNSPFDSFASSSREVFSQGQYHKLLLSMFSHGDVAHLASNLLGFVGFGYLLKRHFGSLAFPVVPVLLGFLTTVLTTVSMPETHSVIGSSGIVFAQVGLYVTLYYMFENRFSRTVKMLRVVGFLLVLFFPHEYTENVSYLAHGIGFSLGVLSAFVIRPYVGKDTTSSNSENYRYKRFRPLPGTYSKSSSENSRFQYA